MYDVFLVANLGDRWAFQLLFAVTNQMLGYGLAGVCRRWLVVSHILRPSVSPLEWFHELQNMIPSTMNCPRSRSMSCIF
jgi:hypothetical protein